MTDDEFEATPEAKRQPVLGSRSFYCPRCNTFANQEWDDLQVSGGMGWIDFADEPSTFWKRARCAACGRSSVWRAKTMVFPNRTAAPQPHADMPPDVREIYEEAADIQSRSPRAAAALSRASLERLLKGLDHDAPAGTRLDEYIARLEPKVSEPLWQMLTVVRHVGNVALHSDEPDEAVALILEGPSTEMASMIFLTINDTVEELITRPGRAQLVYDMIPRGVREAAERKAGAAVKTNRS